MTIRTLTTVSAICGVFWWTSLTHPEYVGVVAVAFISTCCGVALVRRIRQAFTFADRDLADFIAGKPTPIIPHKLKDPVTGQFVSRQELLHAALARDAAESFGGTNEQS